MTLHLLLGQCIHVRMFDVTQTTNSWEAFHCKFKNMFYSAHRHNRLSFSSSMSKNRRQVCAKDDFMRQNIAKYENGQIPRLGYLKKKIN